MSTAQQMTHAPAAAVPPDDRRFARLRWRCRRGMLENDLILTRFLDARGEAITEDEVAALDRLLDFTDNELWDLLSGRAEPADASLRPLVVSLRAA
jgi:antitoxin CptB